MKKSIVYLSALLLMFSTATIAQDNDPSTGQKIKKGAKNTGKAIGKGAKKQVIKLLSIV